LLQRLELLRRRFNNLVDRHAKSAQRGGDDLFLHRFIGARRQGGEQLEGAGDTLALGRVDARRLEDLVIVHFSAGRGGWGGREDVELRRSRSSGLYRGVVSGWGGLRL